MKIKKAEKKNASELAFLINLAGEGIPEYLWSNIATNDQTPFDIGAERASREEGGFSYRNAMICGEENTLFGMILSYKQPSPYPLDEIDEYPDFVKPMVRLEAKAPGSWYINALATYEQFQGRGVAKALLKDTEKQAKLNHCDSLSIIVSSENIRAKQLYEFCGFKDHAKEPIIPFPGSHLEGDWVLMIKSLNS